MPVTAAPGLNIQPVSGRVVQTLSNNATHLIHRKYVGTSTMIVAFGGTAISATYVSTVRKRVTQIRDAQNHGRPEWPTRTELKEQMRIPRSSVEKPIGQQELSDHILHLASEEYNSDAEYLQTEDRLRSRDLAHVEAGIVTTPAHTEEGSTQQVHYPYTRDLMILEAQRPTVPALLPVLGRAITTPLIVDHWRLALQNHPDVQFREYILQGLIHGFHIGFNRNHPCKSATENMRSALANPQPVDEYLATELAAGRVVGPFTSEQVIGAQVSRFGVIPKHNQPNKWRLILDLSSPKGYSVNDGISSGVCSLSYASVDDAVQEIMKRGKGTKLAKVDVEHAYRNIPVHREDRLLLAMCWKEGIYLDTVLPFGLRSAPKIFSAVADALEWILAHHGVTAVMHYLDDFLTMGESNSNECAINLEKIQRVCEFLGMPLKLEKIEGPATILIFLGILIDTLQLELRLPEEKMSEIKALLKEWERKQSCTKRALLRLVGKLAHAAKVIPPGRTFLRRMIDTAHSVTDLDHHIKLKAEFHSDLYWWREFMHRWNGKSFMESHIKYWCPRIHFSTDASGKWGCGALWGNKWIQCPWQNHWSNKGITIKEMLPIVLACALWGHEWRHKQVEVACDNQAVVEVLKKRTSKDKDIMHMLRCLHFFLAIHNIQLRATHISGCNNTAADAISRNLMQVFVKEVPEAQTEPEEMPAALWNLLVVSQPDWMSINWRQLLSNCANPALLSVPKEVINQHREPI